MSEHIAQPELGEPGDENISPASTVDESNQGYIYRLNNANKNYKQTGGASGEPKTIKTTT